MNKQEKTRGGSASVVIIAFLFVALMASLGVVFYQNFIQKKPEPNPAQTESGVKNGLVTKTARITFDNAIYSVEYPESGWSVTSTSADSGSHVALVGPSESVRVYFEISPVQTDNVCDTNDGLQISDYFVSETPVVTKLTTQPLYYVAALTDAKDGGYQYVAGLTPEGGETHASVGASHCEVEGVGVASHLVMDEKVTKQPAITARITFPKLPAAPKAAAPDRQTIKNLMNTDDYKAAVKILESARKE